MELVEAGRNDVDALAEYWFSLASEMERYSELNELVVERPSDARAGFERQLDREDVTVFLLETGGTHVGYLTLRDGERPSRERSRYAEVVDLFVEPEHRNRGHGSDALDAIREIAAERGANYISVSCEWDNERAREFYADNDFSEKQVTFTQRIDAEDA